MEKSLEYINYCKRVEVSNDPREVHLHQGNHPSDFDTLTEPEQTALLYWIEHAISRAKKADDRSSYGLKHDFEREGFYITNGQFKGAMLQAGYSPKDANELNWTFPIRKTYTRKNTDTRSTDFDFVGRYSLAGFDLKFAKLLIATGHLS